MNKDFIELLKKAQQGDERALEKCYTEKDVLSLINTMECEPHRELFVRGLYNCANKKAEE